MWQTTTMKSGMVRDIQRDFQIIEESLGEHFDPLLGRVFMKCRPELENIYDNYSYE